MTLKCELTREAVFEQLEKILSSDAFTNSQRMQSFLRYIVTETLEERSDQLKEFTIAQDVFEKGDDYDPKNSSQVRVEANRLRKRLEKYYSEHPQDEIVVSLPKGGYRVQFDTLEKSRLIQAEEYFSDLVTARARRNKLRMAPILALDIQRTIKYQGDFDVGENLKFAQHLINPTIEKHEGVFSGIAGDALIYEFPIAEDALSAALAVLEYLKFSNTGAPEQEGRFARIGLDSGSVQDGPKGLTGSAVDEAVAMMETPPQFDFGVTGSICDQFNRRKNVHFTYIGGRLSQDKSRRYRAYGVQLGQSPETSQNVLGLNDFQTSTSRFGTLGIVGKSAIALVCAVVAYGTYHFTVEMPRLSAELDQAEVKLHVDQEKALIAVFPLTAIPGDPEDLEEAEDLTVHTIYYLTQNPDLSVISHGATHQYRGRIMDMRKFGAEVGARFVLSGTLALEGDEHSVSAELIRVSNGQNLWSGSIAFDETRVSDDRPLESLLAEILAKDTYNALLQELDE